MMHATSGFRMGSVPVKYFRDPHLCKSSTLFCETEEMTLPKRQKLFRTKSDLESNTALNRQWRKCSPSNTKLSAAIQGEKWRWPPAGSNKLEAVQSAISFLIHPQLVIMDSVSLNPGSDGQFPARSA
ncbi:hypothetical protein POTOM_042888 [Populus tomentosa]|uniref:Uncharacterized protein n=1 Tax=Populus tomentosa TaxID=118781 RepID=A0A8X7YHE7_POPTO|nr:hypothetical protein POTOM_042888 [Populus tomentosa]